jgi:hypothetical protein
MRLDIIIGNRDAGEEDYFVLGSSYKTLTDSGFESSLWVSCPRCSAKPRVWIFDNGRYAACKCYTVYSNKVSAVSIMEHYSRHGTTENYPDEELRDRWNYRCEMLIGMMWMLATPPRLLDGDNLPF